MMSRILMLLATTLLVASDSAPPSLIPESKIEARYTDEARDAKVNGEVLLEITIDAEGVPSGVKVVKALGYGLDENAMDAVRQWRFRPAMKDGKPVSTLANVQFNFRLTDSPPPAR